MKKIISLLSIAIFCTIFVFSNLTTIKAEIPPGTTCSNIDTLIFQRESRYKDYAGRYGENDPRTLRVKAYYNEAVQWKKDNCNKPCPYSKPFDVVSLGNEVDNSPYYLSKFVMKDSGDAAFCIQPDALYKTGCTNYQGGTAYVALALSSQEIFQCLVCFS